MLLKRKRVDNEGVFQCVGYRHKPSGAVGLKKGGYFVSLQACKMIEEEFHGQPSSEILDELSARSSPMPPSVAAAGSCSSNVIATQPADSSSGSNSLVPSAAYPLRAVMAVEASPSMSSPQGQQSWEPEAYVHQISRAAASSSSGWQSSTSSMHQVQLLSSSSSNVPSILMETGAANPAAAATLSNYPSTTTATTTTTTAAPTPSYPAFIQSLPTLTPVYYISQPAPAFTGSQITPAAPSQLAAPTTGYQFIMPTAQAASGQYYIASAAADPPQSNNPTVIYSSNPSFLASGSTANSLFTNSANSSAASTFGGGGGVLFPTSNLPNASFARISFGDQSSASSAASPFFISHPMSHATLTEAVYGCECGFCRVRR
eukprot:TRINITY_DN6146_c0_g1_i1.p1 TRINITY_DN6146_c0_g1~~TRINITY_DN6146_c0_g1_i1.p1  ORF type:complete len:374 (+),score=93.61 TRINITY_DN6146_c0_g1_i1:494-1615(+)